MTRKHFERIAWQLRREHPRVRAEEGNYPHEIASDEYYTAVLTWERCALAMADACSSFNGNFDRDRFLMAAGYVVRPDGSMYR